MVTRKELLEVLETAPGLRTVSENSLAALITRIRNKLEGMAAISIYREGYLLTSQHWDRSKRF